MGKDVSVLGWYGHQNVGDESYKISFPKMFPDRQFAFNDPKSTDVETDTCVVGGGDILNEMYVKKLLSVKAKRHLAVSISANINSPLTLLKELDGIYLRDHHSVKFLKNHGIDSIYMPDVSTCLQGSAARGLPLIKKMFAADGLDLYEKKIAIVFNAYLFSGKSDMLARDYITFSKVVSDLSQVLDTTNASFIFFPMSSGMPSDDRVTNGFLANRCKFWKKNLVVYDRLSVQNTLDLIAACDLTISSRLHASIFSMNNQVPFIDITHHDKNRYFLETIGWEHSVSYWNFDSEKMKSLVKKMLDDSLKYREELAIIHQSQMDILRKESSDVRFD
jgi:polysaccharide pyruvyl transferase WcaK-like protein